MVGELQQKVYLQFSVISSYGLACATIHQYMGIKQCIKTVLDGVVIQDDSSLKILCK